jgi:hypothetical protein
MFFPSYENAPDITGVWLVGGAVRDFCITKNLLSITNSSSSTSTCYNDLDYAVEAKSWETMHDWVLNLGEVLTITKAYGTLKAKLTDEEDKKDESTFVSHEDNAHLRFCLVSKRRTI